MTNDDLEWTRDRAEELIHNVFDRAKAGQVQTVHDENGKFEVRFVEDDKKTTAGAVLGKGGPGGL